MKYCLDTNFFLILWYEYYSHEVFIDFWDRLIELARNKICYIPKEVYEEIVSGKKEKRDLLSEYLKRNKESFVCDFNTDIEKYYIELMKKKEVADMIDNKNLKNSADVFIMSYSQYFKSKVVTLDKKLISVCRNNNITPIKPFEFIKENGISFKTNINII